MNGYKPSPWGVEFHSNSCDEMLGGGSAGPGKSLALLMDPCEQFVVEHERCKNGEVDWGRSAGWGLHLRREFPRLEQSIHRSKLLFTQLDAGAVYDSNQKRWTFSSGMKLEFGHLSEKDSFLRYRSQEYTWIGIDEVGEIESKDIYDEIVLRCRTADPVLGKMLKVRCTANPTPNWVRSHFVDPAPEGRKILAKDVTLADGSVITRTRMFLPARLSDNPDAAFRRRYEASLLDRPYHIRASLLLGDWYVVAGSFYADLWDPSRVVVKPFKIPAGWKRFRSGDWGYKSPCVILWWAISPEGEMICYRELTLNGTKSKQKFDARGVALKIREIEMATPGEWNRLKDCSRLTGPMDNQLWEERGHTGPTMSADMARAGVFWTRSSKGRRQCAQQLMKRLHQRGCNDRPGIMFFDNCVGCITTIPAIGTDEVDPEVPKKGGPDHHLDAVFYACAANPLPSGVEDAQPDGDDEDERDMKAERGRGQYGYGS